MTNESALLFRTRADAPFGAGARVGYTELLAVFGHCTAGYLQPLVVQKRGYGIIAQRCRFILVFDKVANGFKNIVCRHVGV